MFCMFWIFLKFLLTYQLQNGIISDIMELSHYFSTVFDHVSDPINCTEVKEAICKIGIDMAASWLY